MMQYTIPDSATIEALARISTPVMNWLDGRGGTTSNQQDDEALLDAIDEIRQTISEFFREMLTRDRKQWPYGECYDKLKKEKVYGWNTARMKPLVKGSYKWIAAICTPRMLKKLKGKKPNDGKLWELEELRNIGIEGEEFFVDRDDASHIIAIITMLREVFSQVCGGESFDWVGPNNAPDGLAVVPPANELPPGADRKRRRSSRSPATSSVVDLSVDSGSSTPVIHEDSNQRTRQKKTKRKSDPVVFNENIITNLPVEASSPVISRVGSSSNPTDGIERDTNVVTFNAPHPANVTSVSPPLTIIPPLQVLRQEQVPTHPEADSNESIVISLLQSQPRTSILSELEIKPYTSVISTDISLCKGSFGDVVIGTWKQKHVAIKSLKNDDGEHEILVMHLLAQPQQHPNLIEILGFTRNGTSMQIIQELASYGSLNMILYDKVNFPDLPSQLQLAWITDLANALSYLHSKNIKHRDVKAENCLLCTGFILKICDFGIAKQHTAGLTGANTMAAGTLSFMAPEVKLFKGSTIASDMFSFGVTVIQILSRALPPAQGNHEHQVLLQQLMNEKGIDSDLFVLLLGCLLDNPCNRSLSKTIYEHCKNHLQANGGDPRVEQSPIHNQVTAIQRIADRVLNKVKWRADNESLRIALVRWQTNRHEAITKYGDIQQWDTSNVTDMSGLFRDSKTFNEDISGWDTSNVVDMSYMFADAVAFNQPLNDWKVDQVTNMKGMFCGATSFNQALDKWNTTNVTSMDAMFAGAIRFKSPLNDWDVSNVTSMKSMFQDAYEFNQPLDNWQVMKVTDMTAMFADARRFNQPLNIWAVVKVKTMCKMFWEASVFNQSIVSWNLINNINVNGMFVDALQFDKRNLPLSLTVQQRYQMFSRALVYQ